LRPAGTAERVLAMAILSLRPSVKPRVFSFSRGNLVPLCEEIAPNEGIKEGYPPKKS